jgi:hypothetical protein
MPITVELALMAHTSWRRSVADLFARTIVVNRPPPQAHRAPAYPMFSAKDEEFGPKPWLSPMLSVITVQSAAYRDVVPHP